MKKYIPYAVLTAIAAVVVVVGVVVFTGGSRHHKATTPVPSQSSKQPSPDRAGQLYAGVYNQTPPVTTRIVKIGRCIVSPKDAKIYACAFKMQNGSGATACFVIGFQLDVATKALKTIGQPTQLDPKKTSACPA